MSDLLVQLDDVHLDNALRDLDVPQVSISPPNEGNRIYEPRSYVDPRYLFVPQTGHTGRLAPH